MWLSNPRLTNGPFHRDCAGLRSLCDKGLLLGARRRAVRLSAFTVVDDYPSDPPVDRLLEVVRLAEAAEEGGLSALWIAEHHFHSGGISPSPPVLLAALGARTRRLRLGALVSVLPFHRAIELAEQYAMLDHLLEGRLNLGVGSGYIPLEFEGFGVDPLQKRELFDRSLETLLAAFEGKEVRADAPNAKPVRINVRPVQRPHPPLWIAVQRREAIPFVARRGASIALVPYATLSTPVELADEVREYRRNLPPGARGEAAAALHLYAGPHPDRARHALQRYLDSRLATQSAFYQEKVRRDPAHANAATIEKGGWAIFGSPEEVAGRLRAFASTGVDEVLGIFDFGGLPSDEVGRSVRALGAAFAREGRPAEPT
jgi:alkanesulfonate monooxygenase SsuD/methylene tetrahydromethanopterin reductase-like flavin-dependent oxidoreductase (luciferase family)